MTATVALTGAGTALSHSRRGQPRQGCLPWEQGGGGGGGYWMWPGLAGQLLDPWIPRLDTSSLTPSPPPISLGLKGKKDPRKKRKKEINTC